MMTQLYYSRKVNCYNLTVYEGALPNNAFCYVWTELDGRRGSVEIGTALYRYFTSLTEHVKHVTLFSDTCSGQNRNQNVSALLMHTVQTTGIEVIEQKFFESGHSMMECDSMHSAIERAKKNVPVYSIHDWMNIMRQARTTRSKKNPYQIVQLRHGDFLDLDSLSKSLLCNRTHDTNREKVKWLKVKTFRYEKANPGQLLYRYGYDGEFAIIHTAGIGRKQNCTGTLATKYKESLTITQAKKNDLLRLCTIGAIPSEFHSWFKFLPTSKFARDVNPGPAAGEDSDDECE